MKRRSLGHALASASVAFTVAFAGAGCRRDQVIVKADELAIPKSVTDVTLPSSVLPAPAHATASLRVYVGRRDLAMGSPPRVIARLPEDAVARAHGFDGALKRSGPNDLFLVPLHAAVPKGQDSALVYVDRETPYRVLIEVLFTLGQSEVARYHFVTTHGTDPLGTFEVVPPRACTPGPQSSTPAPHSKPCVPTNDRTPRLGLTVLVVDGGFSIKARGGNVAPGCSDTGPGLAIPVVAGHHDVAALTACLTRLKAASPDFATEHEITISASPGITAQTVFATIEAARGNDDAGLLFPDVMFGVSR